MVALSGCRASRSASRPGERIGLVDLGNEFCVVRPRTERVQAMIEPGTKTLAGEMVLAVPFQ